MDTIRITEKYTREDYLGEQRIRWKLYSLKFNKLLINLTFFAFVLIILGLLGNSDNKLISFPTYLGITFLIMMFSFMIYRHFDKIKFFRNHEKIADIYDLAKMEYSFEINEEYIKYWDSDKIIQMKWTLFSQYSIYKDYLIITYGNSLNESYFFLNKDCRYEKLLEFVKSNLEYIEFK